MRTFFIIWFGQLVSTIGSRMTGFALEIWAWEITGEATTLALASFFHLVPSILIAPVAGVIVDRWNRKLLMIVGDTVAVLSTLALLFLYLSHQLQIWHIYTIGALDSTFIQLQGLAYSASITLMVPRRHYTRVSSMGFFSYYGSEMIAPALAGCLYYIIGFVGITLIDSFTFVFAISTLLFVFIPHPAERTETRNLSANLEPQSSSIWQEFYSGLNYINLRPSLLIFLVISSLFWFFLSVSDAIYSPLILARTGNDARILGIVLSSAGLGGVASAIVISVWGGSSYRIQGVLFGMIGVGLSKTIFGYSQTLLTWIPSQFCASASVTLRGSSEQALWLSKVSPKMQGRVFAIRQMAQHITVAIAYLIAGPLADRIFEPAMKSGGILSPFLGNLFGTGDGAGIALLFVLCSICMLLIGIIGYTLPNLRNLERNLHDRDVASILTQD